jgi:splicing factor 3A subunit 1
MMPGRPPMGGVPPQTGMVRSADQMDGGEEAPPAKRQKIAKLPGGSYYPEADWINMHSVSSFVA